MTDTLLRADSEYDQDLTFEVSRELKVTTKLTYKKGDAVDFLIDKIKELEAKVTTLTATHKPAETSLIELWDNPYDDKWDDN